MREIRNVTITSFPYTLYLPPSASIVHHEWDFRFGKPELVIDYVTAVGDHTSGKWVEFTLHRKYSTDMHDEAEFFSKCAGDDRIGVSTAFVFARWGGVNTAA